MVLASGDLSPDENADRVRRSRVVVALSNKSSGMHCLTAITRALNHFVFFLSWVTARAIRQTARARRHDPLVSRREADHAARPCKRWFVSFRV